MSKDQVLEKLRDSLINSKEEIETKSFEESIKNTGNPNDAVELVKKIDKFIKCSKNNILMLAYQQGKVFQNLKKKSSKFINAVTEFGISKTTINFKKDVVNFINQYPGMRKSAISLFYLKNNFRTIKNVCQEHASEHVFCLIFFIILVLTHFKSVFFLYKKGSWSLLAKIDTSLLRISIFYSCFFHTFCK